MWFSLRKELANSLPLRLVGFSSAAHMGVLLLVFLGEMRWFGEKLIFSAKQPGARVSMLPSSGRSLVQQSVVSNQSKTQAPAQKSKPAKAAIPKKKSTPLPVSKKAEQKKVSAKPAQKKVQESKTQPLGPTYSELKKSYTSLKREKKKETNDTHKEQPLPADASPLKKESPQTREITQKKIEPKEHTNGMSGTVAQGVSSSGTAERIEVDVEEALWSSNEYVREFGRHYVIPPGFEDHEPFTVTCEIKEGKVVAINPRGDEPLVLYAAAKDALLKMNVARSKYTKKLVFIIK